MDKQGISYSKFFILESYEGDFSIVKDKIFNKKLKVPTSDIYVPANPRLLSKFGVLRSLQAFTAFRERSEGKEMMEYKSLERALEEIFLIKKSSH